MIVCHCHVVTDREIRRVARVGAGSVDQVGEACGAGTGCGGCRDLVRQIVTEERCSAEDCDRSLPLFAAVSTA